MEINASWWLSCNCFLLIDLYKTGRQTLWTKWTGSCSFFRGRLYSWSPQYVYKHSCSVDNCVTCECMYCTSWPGPQGICKSIPCRHACVFVLRVWWVWSALRDCSRVSSVGRKESVALCVSRSPQICSKRSSLCFSISLASSKLCAPLVSKILPKDTLKSSFSFSHNKSCLTLFL